MKIVCIADTHGKHNGLKLPRGDVLVFAGDITPCGQLSALGSFNKWLNSLDFQFKIVIAGNHDHCFESQLRDVAKKTLTNCLYLEDSGVTIGEVKFWGSPYQPKFLDWAFNLDRGERLRDKWALVPSDVNVLITHCPPFNVLDKTDGGEHIGCEELAKRITELKRLRLHVFGHVHEAYGTVKKDQVTSVNVSTCNAIYDPVHSPVVVNIEHTGHLSVEI